MGADAMGELMTRRDVLRGTLATGLSLVLPGLAGAAVVPARDRQLWPLDEADFFDGGFRFSLTRRMLSGPADAEEFCRAICTANARPFGGLPAGALLLEGIRTRADLQEANVGGWKVYTTRRLGLVTYTFRCLYRHWPEPLYPRHDFGMLPWGEPA
jgi:hypothetical protein